MRNGSSGALGQFITGEPVDRMYEDGKRVAGGAGHLCAELGGSDKGLRQEQGSRDAPAFESKAVVHTARRAAPSVADAGNHGVKPVRHVIGE